VLIFSKKLLESMGISSAKFGSVSLKTGADENKKAATIKKRIFQFIFSLLISKTD
jgi:hypothetical protein